MWWGINQLSCGYSHCLAFLPEMVKGYLWEKGGMKRSALIAECKDDLTSTVKKELLDLNRPNLSLLRFFN